ncbi:MAG TPA: ATP-binding protein [Solirubrobacteraceae bacterium]|jgi:anti-sigma regulatory factor (Ser/Thr protein kinase)
MTGLAVARSVPAVAENIAPLRRAVGELAERAGGSSRLAGDVALAVGEACGNVVLHAYPPGETGPLILEARVRDRDLEVIVSDMGRGMVPRPEVSGLGLGLPLMTTLARQLSITDGEGGRGTAVRMVFALDD